jgi:cytochrome c-type biogenesis protein
MGIFEAFGQGFASFFSIWQVCILQISPFFLAFVTGAYFIGYSAHSRPGIGRRVVLLSASFALGFGVFYALSSVTGLPVGRFLSYYGGTLSLVSGIAIVLVSLALILSGRVRFLGANPHVAVLGGAALLLGVTFALVYSPCITPALSDILGLTTRPETAVRGGVLAFSYSLGISLGLGVTAMVLIFLLRGIGAAARHPRRVKDIGALVLMILGLLNVTGLMVYYKAFVLGFLVP